MAHRRIKRFNVTEYNQRHHRHTDIAFSEVAVAVEEAMAVKSKTAFEEVVYKFEKAMEQEFNKISESKEGQELVDNETLAIGGRSENISILLERIETFLKHNRIRNTEIPPYYEGLHHFVAPEHRKFSNLSHAIFQEMYGWNRLACWHMYPDSYAMQVIGDAIWIYMPKLGRSVSMDFKLPPEQLSRIIRALETHKTHDKINEGKPELELDLFTGERVSILIEPRVIRKTITFRRVLVKKPTLEESAKNGVFPEEAVLLFRGLSRTMCNMVFAGPMGTIKTHMLKAMVHERDDHITGISVEKEYEIAVSRDNPNKKFIELITRGASFDSVIEKVLRLDAYYGIIQEVRMVEAEGAMIMCEKLQKGFITTTHLWRPETLPDQWGRAIVKINGFGDPQQEAKRVAEYMDLVIQMEQDETKVHKRVNSIQELRFNRENGEISTHQIMRRNDETGEYEYRFDLSPQLMKEMRSINRIEAEKVFAFLRDMEAISPIPQREGVTVFNPAIADPQYRAALAMEKMAAAQTENNEIMKQLLETLRGGGNKS